MTEEEWLTCDDPTPMLEFLRGKGSDRKLRLFGVECCRRIWQLLPKKQCKTAVELAEQYADGKCDDAALRAASEAVVSGLTRWRSIGEVGELAATAVACVSSLGDVAQTAENASYAHGVKISLDDHASEQQLEQARQAAIFRDLFGNPFRPVAFDPAWRTEAVVGLARGIYDDRAFERMPILADALQEAGCEHPDLLSHCREPGEHVRGCWVVDLVLGKA